MFNIDATLFFSLLTLILVGIAGYITLRRPLLPVNVDDLQRVINVMQQDRIKDANRITELERQLADAIQEIAYLRGRLEQYENADVELFFPLLVICGPDETIAQADLAAIRQANFAFRRIINATKETITDELTRRREAGDLPRFIHVAAHSGPQGIQLADGVADQRFWNEQLTGIEGVFLAGCANVKVADWIIGVVDWVLSTTEPVRNDQAKAFTRAFWLCVGQNKTAQQAYRRACQVVPMFREYTDFRD